MQGKRIMIFGISAFVHGIKIMQSYKSRKINDASILLVFLEVSDQVSEFKQFIKELS